MRFIKEYIVLISIIVFLIVTEIYISTVTKKSIEESEKMVDYVIENALNKEDYKKEDEIKKVEEFEKVWKKIEDRLSYFTEHNELEKVSAAIAEMKGCVESGLQEDAYMKMKEIKFRIEHIKTKQKFALNNLF